MKYAQQIEEEKIIERERGSIRGPRMEILSLASRGLVGKIGLLFSRDLQHQYHHQPVLYL